RVSGCELAAAFGQDPLVPVHGLAGVPGGQVGGGQVGGHDQGVRVARHQLGVTAGGQVPQYSTAGPTRRASSRLRPARSSTGWQPSAHSPSVGASCRAAAFNRRATAVHGPASSTGQISSRALAAVRAAGSWTLAGAASLIAAWSTEFTRMVGGETARLTL